jgi:hypothetical protein
MGMVRTWDREFESMLWYYKNACRYLEGCRGGMRGVGKPKEQHRCFLCPRSILHT